MGQCCYSFPLYPKLRNTEALCAVSVFESSSSFLPTVNQTVNQTSWRGELSTWIQKQNHCLQTTSSPQNWVAALVRILEFILIIISSCVSVSTWETNLELEWNVLGHFVNFVAVQALQMRVYCHTGYTPFYSFPPALSAPCNLILLATAAPPPRRLTFPLIHKRSEGSKHPHSFSLQPPHCIHWPNSTH